MFILHPRGKISPVQEAQMTSVLDSNVHNVAVDGTFDDCQVRAVMDEDDYICKYLLIIDRILLKPCLQIQR